MIDSLTNASATLANIGNIPPLYYLAPVGGILALIMAKTFSAAVMKSSEGDDEMVRIAQAVREGAMAYLVRQYKVVAGVFECLNPYRPGLVGVDQLYCQPQAFLQPLYRTLDKVPHPQQLTDVDITVLTLDEAG